MAETWNDEDVARYHDLLEQQLMKLSSAITRALEKTRPRLKTQFPKLDRIEIAHTIFWPGDGIPEIERGGHSCKIDSPAERMACCTAIVKATHHAPRGMLDALKALEKATTIVETADKVRRDAAQAMLDVQAQDIHELRSLFVAEELKKSNEQ